MALGGEFRTFLDRMKSQLLNDASLSFLAAPRGIVDIRRHRNDELPDFEKYAVILNPESETELSNAGVNGKRKIWKVTIYCLVRKYHPTDSLIGSTPPEQVGILHLLDLVKDSVRCKLFGAPPPGLDGSGYIEVTKQELDGELPLSGFSIPSESRENYFHEIAIPFEAHGRIFVMPVPS